MEDVVGDRRRQVVQSSFMHIRNRNSLKKSYQKGSTRLLDTQHGRTH